MRLRLACNAQRLRDVGKGLRSRIPEQGAGMKLHRLTRPLRCAAHRCGRRLSACVADCRGRRQERFG